MDEDTASVIQTGRRIILAMYRQSLAREPIEVIIDELRESRESQRRSVMIVLQEKGARAVPALIAELLKDLPGDDHSYVPTDLRVDDWCDEPYEPDDEKPYREMVVRALGRAAEQSVKAITPLLMDSRHWIRRDAARVLEMIGPLAYEAIDHLRPLLRDKNPIVQTAARHAFKSIHDCEATNQTERQRPS
jgi:HEAT repeat protein